MLYYVFSKISEPESSVLTFVICKVSTPNLGWWYPLEQVWLVVEGIQKCYSNTIKYHVYLFSNEQVCVDEINLFGVKYLMAISYFSDGVTSLC